MVWRGRTDIPDRILGSLPYLLPLSYFAVLGSGLVAALPFLRGLQQILTPVYLVLGLAGGLVGLGIFIALMALVVRNQKVLHFIRFNTLQSMLLSIGLTLVVALIQLLGLLGLPLVPQLAELTFTISSAALLAGISYIWIQNAQGKYPEIPYISDVAYNFCGMR